MQLIFFDPKNFLTQKFFSPKFSSNQKTLFSQKYIFDRKIISTQQIFFQPQIFFLQLFQFESALTELGTTQSQLVFIHSVSNFLGFVLVKALPIGASCPTVQLYTRQEREWERE